jgi:hypothetical protein
MKVTIAAHDEWPSPMSNAPEPPPEPSGGMPRPITPATDRHNRGKAHFGHVLNWWMAKSDLTSRQLSRIADWGLDEKGWLHDGKISQLRRNYFVRALPIRYMDACGAANQAIWTWQCRGEHEAIAKYGPPGKDKIDTKWLNAAIWVPHPDYPSEPLGPADWFDVATGYLEIPQVASPVLAPTEGPQLTDELCRLLLSLVASESQRDQVRHLVRVYPVTDRERRDRFASVLIGATVYDSAEIEQELYAMATIVAELRGLTTTDYGPAELYAELTADRRQNGGAAGGD